MAVAIIYRDMYNKFHVASGHLTLQQKRDIECFGYWIILNYLTTLYRRSSNFSSVISIIHPKCLKKI